VESETIKDEQFHHHPSSILAMEFCQSRNNTRNHPVKSTYTIIDMDIYIHENDRYMDTNDKHHGFPSQTVKFPEDAPLEYT
jgi:hypothetical protein